MVVGKKKSVKKRIFQLNIAMIFTAMVILLFVMTGSIKIIISYYAKSNMMISYVDKNALQVEGILEGKDVVFESFEDLAVQIKNYEYELFVYQEENLIYATIDLEMPNRTNTRRNTEREFFYQGDGIYAMFGVTFVNHKIMYEGEIYQVIAIQNENLDSLFVMMEDFFADFYMHVAFVGICTVVILVLLGLTFSKKLISNIMRPLELLNKGAKRVAAGNMEEFIEYRGDMEFEEVCDVFNAMQQDIKMHNEERQRYEQARTDMVTSISHDLRTPLTSIKGYIKGILDGVANTPKKQEDYLMTAYGATEDMDLLLQKLFVFSKIETGKMPFDFIPVNLPEYVNQYVASREKQYQDKNLEIRLKLPENEFEGYYDIVQMQRVFDNILENSLHYADRQHIIVEISYRETKEEEILYFKDNGNGVPYDKLPFIFDRFYRADESRGTEGNGVGLYIVEHIIKEHKGEIRGENQNGLLLTMRFKKQKR
ncbi:HAMP domain-containing histidine kinase [Lachnospiraceae bacterium OttesenSCG-928-D06]|nr:HAMP domain-containing histidine kinase [Lachnospiraceae bacterium OttesenSCG-928-D06]